MYVFQNQFFSGKLNLLISKRIFELLGFMEEVVDRDITLRPPVTDTATPAGKQNRRKLLRAWLEISSWLADFKRVNGNLT